MRGRLNPISTVATTPGVWADGPTSELFISTMFSYSNSTLTSSTTGGAPVPHLFVVGFDGQSGEIVLEVEVKNPFIDIEALDVSRNLGV